jgi:hypothetical protein
MQNESLLADLYRTVKDEELLPVQILELLSCDGQISSDKGIGGVLGRHRFLNVQVLSRFFFFLYVKTRRVPPQPEERAFS